MRRRAAVAIVVSGVLGAAAVAHAQSDHDQMLAGTTEVGISYAAFSPPEIDVLAGDTVHWHNASVRAHTIVADDGSFDAGRLISGDDFSRTFPDAGVVGYHCTLHAGMVGQIRVSDVLLEQPPDAASAGRPFPVRGSAAMASGTPVTLEADTGTGFTAVATTRVGDDRTFGAEFTPTTTSRIRAVVGDVTSAPIDLIVLDRHLTATVARRGVRVTFDATVAPAAPGGTVVLQLRLPERFGWWPVARTRLDAASHARLALRLRRRVPARLLLTLPDGATVLAKGPTLRVPAVPARRRR